jgi:hypothetical protein
MSVRRRGARKDKVWLSTFSSGNHVVRLAIGIPGFPDASGVTVQPWFDGQAPDDFSNRRVAALVDAQDSVQKSTPDNFQNDTHGLQDLCTPQPLA